MSVETLELWGDGFSSFALLVNDNLVFRVAKHAGVTAGYARERQLLPELQAFLPVPVPEPRWYAPALEHFPFGVIGYPLIRGTPFKLELAPQVDLSRLADGLADFMLALHGAQLEPKPQAATDAPADALTDTLTAVLPFLNTQLSTEHCEHLEKTLDVDPASAPQGLTHGDLWAENLLLDTDLTRLVGVVDFETVGYGDVARDFAPHRYVSRTFLEEVVNRYLTKGGSLGEAFGQRLNFWSLHRELTGLRYALSYPESGELGDSLAKVVSFCQRREDEEPQPPHSRR